MSQKRRKSRGVVDTSVLVAGVAGMKGSVHESNVASANFIQRWVEKRPFVWLITEEIVEEYREVLARLGVRRPLIGKIINTLRAKGEPVKPGPTRNLSPDPDDNHICDCAEYGDADFIVTLNPKDFPQASLRAKVIGPDDPLPGRRATPRHRNS
ncbi:MAG: PIN domain-containing protein [Candidatus Sulfotelmatobacter sp.]